ncbi:MAG: amidohydrolase [Candidatus Aminicenantes bacterium]|nr:amidohydrolase [Candidatus Aminicenantes bacterium]
MIEDLKKDIKELTPLLIEWRRDFHRHPEIGYEEHRTSSVIRKFLEDLDISVKVYAKTGLRAVLKGKPGGGTVALRADIDALPLKEEGDKEYKSENPEATHACGHDGHMAILMGTARLLSQRKEQFKGKVIFLFQPSEEIIPGGAKKMIEEGVLEGVDAIFGLHLWQPLPTGTVGIVKGAMMAQPDAFSVTVKGKGGHGSMPHTAVDPILVASHLVVNTQSIVSRNVDPLKPVVVSFGTVKGGTIYNIIPGEVSLTGTVRTFDPSLQSLVERRLKEITEETCKAFGATAEFQYEKGYPPLVNHEAMVDLALDVVKKTLGEERIRDIDPVMGGEDFAYFLEKVPGAFLFFGMGDGMEFPHHHPAFDLDEKALPQAALLMTGLALEFLQRNE